MLHCQKDNVKVTYNANLNGATTEYTVPADISVAKNTPVTISKWTQGEQAVNDSAVTATKDGKIYEFKGWSATQSEPADASGLYAAGRELKVTTNITLYAIWEKKEEEKPDPNPPTDTVDAKYFVLMPSANAPSSGKDQGWDNYFPSKRTENGQPIGDNGGVEDASRATGYAGKITQDAANLVKNKGDDGYFNATGVEDTYLAQKPTNLGYFDANNYNKEGTTWTYAGYGNLPATLTAFTMEGKEVVWYVIKNVGTETEPDYHVDGYVKGVDIEVKYHQNFTEGTSWTQTGLQSGNTVKIKDYATVWPDSPRTGYTFTGWNTKSDGSGDSYAAGSTEVLKTSMDLYAQWEQNYTVIFDANGGKWGTNTSIEGYEFNTGKTTATSGTLFASSIVSPVVTPTNGQKNFLGWAASSDSSNLLQLTNPTVAELKNWANVEGTTITLYAIWENSPVQYTYNIHQHFKFSPEDDNDRDTVDVTGLKAEQGKLIAELISDKEQNEKSYIYDASYTTVDGAKYNKETSTLTKDNTDIDLYYYLDSWKDADKAPESGDKDSETGGDGIPDYKQILINYNVFPGFWAGKVNTDYEVATIKDGTTDLDTNLSGSTAIVVNTNYVFVKWVSDKIDTNKVSSVAEITNPKVSEKAAFIPKIDAPVGGTTYTYTAVFNVKAPITQYTYSVKQHLIDSTGQKTDVKDIAKNKTAPTGTDLSALFTAKTPDTIDGKNYVYVPSETTVTINGGNPVTLKNTDKLESNNTVIDLYYYLDETGKTDEKGKDTNEPNNYPDAWEYKATFIVKNGQWDTNPTGGKDTIVKYLPTKDITTGKNIQATLSNVPTAGNTPDSHYKAGSWDPKPNEGEVITKDMTYTYTYSWRSSGGSGGSRPTVTIPDNVPTGLNGTDHYAYIIGYGNNDVRPQNNITRAEVATIFFRLLTDEAREANMTKSNGYNDVKDGDWFCCAVSTLSKMGIIKGYEDGSFKPNDPISRAEFAAIAARFDPDGDKTPATFADVTSHWAKDEISIAANHGWIKGYEDGSFKPDQKITRAETMTLVNRVLNRLPETKDDLHKDMKTWVDNMDETAWYYLAVQEATNSHYFKNKTSTKFEQWTDLRDTRDWSELEK